MLYDARRRLEPQQVLAKEKWARQGSNLRPIGYEPTALPLSYEPTKKWHFKRTQAPLGCQPIAARGTCRFPSPSSLLTRPHIRATIAPLTTESTT